jgi:hypothetical protein
MVNHRLIRLKIRLTVSVQSYKLYNYKDSPRVAADMKNEYKYVRMLITKNLYIWCW